jgi:hypothetical protein
MILNNYAAMRMIRDLRGEPVTVDRLLSCVGLCLTEH